MTVKAHPFLINALFTAAAIVLALSQDRTRSESSFQNMTSSVTAATSTNDWKAKATRSKAAKHSFGIHSAEPPQTTNSIHSAAAPSNIGEHDAIKCPTYAPVTPYDTQNTTLASSISIGYL
mmetsp:Transcript_14897/g.30456  ORF Transcript_14897/g.30456 Transcript_14897/m.30456 type:complete len:121 (+) Transcript_14897:55-417(+)|eukprot:CAMPEP_0113419614 /NCGR_PEP_ID=MMETSP0013_2-20120614/26876_1 /TAXON_ID=2843 ORGANISM="Skeletonema costatum, Strain 1716" /NCGR_SAMPLE_ID=MMETSP0013_2 /ASSEMBLY_ACC=CAM_ASM_000158 /LENGTH=120 /DNA_ID=CAMNT_0000307013 /DNA_START=55 /DNA_END=417 /DNA_ORIENTATION=+ /assembly_acc=CAM_ASM_000158